MERKSKVGSEWAWPATGMVETMTESRQKWWMRARHPWGVRRPAAPGVSFTQIEGEKQKRWKEHGSGKQW